MRAIPGILLYTLCSMRVFLITLTYNKKPETGQLTDQYRRYIAGPDGRVHGIAKPFID
jgi:hypothetical protein